MHNCPKLAATSHFLWEFKRISSGQQYLTCSSTKENFILPFESVLSAYKIDCVLTPLSGSPSISSFELSMQKTKTFLLFPTNVYRFQKNVALKRVPESKSKTTQWYFQPFFKRSYSGNSFGFQNNSPYFSSVKCSKIEVETSVEFLWYVPKCKQHLFFLS